MLTKVLKMDIIQTNIKDLYLIEPKIFRDDRGYFYESFSQREFDEKIGKIHFVQENQSKSKYGVIRGLHFQLNSKAQSKLVRCVQGRILDVAVDLREDSPTFLQYFSVELSEENNKQLFIPKGFAHGFSTLSDTAILQYKCDEFYAPGHEGAILWSDPKLAINWGLSAEDTVVSPKDGIAPSLEQYLKTRAF